MKFIVKEIIDKKEKENIAREVLNDLSEWFGLPESTENYIKESQEKQFLASFYKDELVGFVVLDASSPDCAEIFVMGVKKKFHHHGAGRAVSYTHLDVYKRQDMFLHTNVAT